MIMESYQKLAGEASWLMPENVIRKNFDGNSIWAADGQGRWEAVFSVDW